MTKLQKTRKMLMEQLKAIEENQVDEIKLNGVIGISDALTKTYNTELRAKELEVRADEAGFKLDSLDVFEDM